MPFPPHASVRRVAIVGAGTIGASWTAYFLARGLDVAAHDPSPTGEAFLRGFVERAWPALEALGLAPGASPDRATFFAQPEGAADGAEFVQESAPERLELKQDLLARLDAVLPADRVIASSTSSFRPSELTRRMARGDRLVVGHPFNPPHLIPLVEVVGGPTAAPAAVDWAIGFYRQVGKVPIRLNKEIAGHVSNRLQMAIFREAAHLVAEGVVSVEDVDAAISQGPGLRWAIMGPMQTFALTGGDGGFAHFIAHLRDMVRALWADLGRPEFDDALIEKLTAGVEAATRGRSARERAAARDRALLGILAALRRARTA